jgi:glycosyltransferase involved in cell wall biosynthesis
MTITLCLIVKNEAACLEETVNSCCDDYDDLVIVDTGSTDDTLSASERLGAVIHHFAWVNDFSAARNYAASQCKTDWIFMIDADEELAPECRGMVRKAIDDAAADVSAISPLLDCGSISHYCDKIFRRGKGHWQNPSHNVYIVDEGRSIRAPRIQLIHDRKRRGDELQETRNKQRNEMNEANFRQQVKDDRHNTRAVWYLALTLAEAGKLKESVKWWQRYFRIGDWPEERYEARLELADVLIRLNKTDDAIDNLILAYKDEPRRAEAAMQLGDMYVNGGANLRAEFWYRAAAGIHDPVNAGCQLFMQPRCYGVYPWLRLAGLYKKLDRTDEYEAAIETAKSVAKDDDERQAIGVALGENINTTGYWDAIYREGRDVGDAHRELFNRVVEIIDEVKHDEDFTILDVGAGTGELLDYFSGEGKAGIDFSAEASKHPYILTDDAQQMVTQKADTYDVVTCVSTLEHVDDADAVLEQIRRVAKAGALIVISVPDEGFQDCAEHVRQYTNDSLAEELGRYFSEVKIGRHSAWLVASCIRPRDGHSGSVGTPGTPGPSGPYDRAYFEENPHYGGQYDMHLYPEFERRADELIHWFPQTRDVMEIGCAKGFLIKALLEKGLRAEGMDCSEYATQNAHPDASNHIIQWDVTEGIPCDPEFHDMKDVVCAYDVLEHIPPDKIEFVVSEMKRVARLGVVAYIDLTDCDPTHMTVRSAEFWKGLFGDGARIDPVSAHGTEKIRLIWSKRRTLDIYCGFAYSDWSPETTNRGSWKAVAKLAERLQNDHGWEVRVYAQPPEPRRYDGVQYLPYGDFDPGQHRDVCIASRRPDLFSQPMFAYAKVYRHDDIDEGMSGYLDYPHIFVSNWQAERYRAKYDIPEDSIYVTRNGTDIDSIQIPGDDDSHKRLLFAAQPQRGLDVMLDIWDNYLRDALPDWTLMVCGSFDTWKQERPGDPSCERVQRRAETTSGVELMGMVSEGDLFQMMRESRVLVYPSTYPETSCMVVIEAMAHGLPVVCGDLGALSETVDSAGEIIRGKPTDDDYQQWFADATLQICRDDEVHATYANNGLERSQQYSWDKIAAEWDEYLRRL